MQLKSYQTEAILEIKIANKIVYLPAGSGKSQIVYELFKEIDGPHLIISFKYVLYQHLNCLGKDAYLIEKKIEKNKKIYLITPGLLKKFIAQLPLFKIMVFDESQMFKNRNSKRTKYAIWLSMKNPTAKKICLTATPCPEGIWEIHPQIELLDANNPMGNGLQFAKTYLRKINVGSFWKIVAIKKDEIKKLAQPYIFTRKVEMPHQIDKVISIPMKHRNLYEKAVEDCYVEFEDGIIFLTSSKWIKLLQICSGILIDTEKEITKRLDSSKIELAKEICEESTSQVIIWAIFREELKWLNESIKDSMLIMGGVEGNLNNFKNGNVKVLIANPACIGAGVSLENCHQQIFCSFNASCAMYIQTKARTNRINQKSQEIIYKLVYKDTKQEELFQLLEKKEENLFKALFYDRKRINN